LSVLTWLSVVTDLGLLFSTPTDRRRKARLTDVHMENCRVESEVMDVEMSDGIKLQSSPMLLNVVVIIL